MFPYLTYIPVLLLLIYISIYIYLKNKNNKVNIYFSLFVASIALWVFALLFSDTVKEYNLALFWNKMAIIGPAFLIYFFLLFTKVFPDGNADFSKITKILLLCPALIIIVLSPTALNLEKIIIQDWGAEVFIGPLYYFLFVYYLLYLALSFWILFKKHKQAVSIVKVQIKYIFLGMGISSILGLTTNLILLFFNISQFSLLGPITLLFFIGFTLYAILRYRLMDIRVIIRRSAVFAVLVAIITSVYALFAFLISVFFQGIIGTQSIILNGVITAVFVAIGFEPLKTWLSRATDKYLFKAEYHPQEFLAEFSDKLTTTLELDKINHFIVKRLAEVFKPAFVSVFLLDDDKRIYIRTAMKGQPVKKVTKIDQKLFSTVFNYLKSINQEKEIIVREEIIKINEQVKNKVLDVLIANLNEHGVNLIVPMFLRDKLVGLLFFGDKKSGDVYSQEDLRVLEIISRQAAVAIQNSQLFEEQKNFAAHLEKVVAERTKELKVANQQLKKLDKAKSEFISIASHQLRTPLTVIKGYISMINQGDFGKVSNQVASPLDRVYKSTLRIITLVEDLLNISRIESGRMKYDFSKVDLEKIVASVFEELEQHAKNKGLDFQYIKPAKKIPEIVIDQKKIREVVMNLMDNAIKYTAKGFVSVSLEKKNSHVLYCVTDSGRGLDADEIPMLFKKFSRAKGAKLVHTEGTGLGLYIAKQIVKKHGGKIWAESEGRNKGSKFCIEFKIKNKRLEKEAKKKK